jgi:hypothetical protein
MEKEFVPYELAWELKQLNFDETCFGYYHNLGSTQLVVSKRDLRAYNGNNIEYCLAPLYKQAFRWFREKHNIDAWVQPFVSEKQNGKPFLPDESYVYYIFKDGVYVDDAVNFLNYEEAELACLQKLIEIVKTK